MPITVDGETYFTATEAARYLSVSRDTFNRNVSSQVQQYTFGVLRRTYFRQSELDQFRSARPIERKDQ